MAGWNEWVPGTNMTLSEVLDALKSARVGLDVKDKLYWTFYKVVELAIKEGNANFDVAKAAGTFKDLASRLDASDNDLRNFNVNWINKNIDKLDQSFMSEEFLQQMAGNAPINAVPADRSLTTSKYADKSVTAIKTDFLKVGKNLIDPERVAEGQVNRLTGNIIASDIFEHSDYIDISMFTNLAFSPLPAELARISFAFYDTSLEFISGDNMEGKDYISIPQTAKKIRISWRSNEGITKDVVQLEAGTSATEYEPFETLMESLAISGAQISEGTVTKEKTNFIKNLENQPESDYEIIEFSAYRNSANDGKIMRSDGQLAQTQHTTNYTVTDFIPVSSGAKYNAKFRNVLLCKGTTPVSLIDNPGVLYDTFAVPENVDSARFSIEIELADELNLVRKSPVDSEKVFEIPNLVAGSPLRFQGAKLIQFGDSITANFPEISTTLSQRLGIETLNLAIGGAKMAERNDVPSTVGGGHTANSGIRIAEAIISGDFSNQYLYTNETYTGATLSRMLNTLSLIESTDLSAVTYATVQFGANDYLQGVPIGDLNSDRYTYVGAYKLFIETLSVAYPNLRFIIVSTPIIFSEQPSTYSIGDYVEASRLVAEHFNLPFVENYKEAGINALNRYQYFNTQDGVHPDVSGRLHLGHRIASGIEANY